MTPLRTYRLYTLREPLAKVAKRAGRNISTFSQIERGGPCSPLSIPVLAKGYKLSIAEFERLLNSPSQAKDGAA